MIAEVYFRLDKRAEAVEHLGILLKSHPDYPHARETYDNYHRIVYGN